MVKIGEKIATRTAFGDALLRLGGKYKNIVAIDADLSCSVKTDKFAKHYRDRAFNLGIAEANMMSTAAGFASRGKIPFVATFAVFATGRAYDQIRASICYPNMNVKIMGSHCGIFAGEDGGTHQSLEDIALMRVLPNMKVFCPADAVETAQVMDAICEDFGPTYVRFGRNPVPVIYGADYKFKIGKGSVLREGKDICIFVTGTPIAGCLFAAERFEAEGKSVRVVTLASIKPIDEDLIYTCAQECGVLFSVEDHSVIGGLGSAISEVLTTLRPAKLHRIGMYDKFGESGKATDLYKKYKLDADGLYEQISGLL